MSKLIFLNLCVVSFCAILFASDASFEDDNERSSSSVNHAEEEAAILKKIQSEAATMDRSRATWVFLDSSHTGRLSAVRFLREHFGEEILGKKEMNDALTWASVGGHLPTVKYFMTGTNKAMIDQAGVNDSLVNASWQGHMTVVQYLMALSEGVVPNFNGIKEAIEAAESEKKEDVVRYLSKTISKELVLALEECGATDSEDSDDDESICTIQ